MNNIELYTKFLELRKNQTISATTEECLDVIRKASFVTNFEPQLKALIDYFPQCFELTKISISGKQLIRFVMVFTFTHKYFPSFEQIAIEFSKSGFMVNLYHPQNISWGVKYAVKPTSKHYVSIEEQEKLWNNIFEKIIKMVDKI